MSNNLDALFKKALQGKTTEPPPYIWENIERQVYARKKKRKMLIWWRTVAAVFFCLILLSGLFQLNRRKTEELTAQKMIPIETLKVDKPQIAQHMSSKPVFPVSEPRQISTVNIPAEKKNIEPIDVKSIRLDEGVSATSPSIELKTNVIRKDFIPLTSQNAIKNSQLYNQLLAMELKPGKEEINSEKEKIKLSLSGHITPGYSSGTYNSSLKNSRGVDYSKSQMNGMFNVGGGLKVTVNTGKRLSVQTGIMYSQMGQRTDESNIYVRKTALSSAMLPEGNNVTTPLGQVKNANFVKTAIYNTDGVAGLAAKGVDDGNIEQLFGALEIPFIVKYRLNDNKISFSLSGGFSGGFMVRNQTYLNYQDLHEALGSTEDIRGFNISTDWGISVEYPISRKIKFMVEPGFRYYLQSISRNEAVSFKPYTFSFSTGIGIDF